MKFISFLNGTRSTYGVIDGTDAVDLGPVIGDRAPDLKSLIAQGLLADTAALMTAGARLPLASVELLPVIPNPGAIFCIGLNYHEHVAETHRTVTESPTLFLRVPASQVAHRVSMVLPSESRQFDYEGEIAIIIGKGGRRISEERAWEHIAGYACYNDGSVRDWQLATSQWTAGKNFWRTGAFGPWMVTADEISAGQKMTLVTRLNGVELQRATTDMMIHSIPRQIAFISTFTPLSPGDVIVTGTPGGVGARRTPQIFMKTGDVVEVDVDAIGVLRNQVAAVV